MNKGMAKYFPTTWAKRLLVSLGLVPEVFIEAMKLSGDITLSVCAALTLATVILMVLVVELTSYISQNNTN